LEANVDKRFSLEGKAAVVTGAGAGIGRGIALALAEAGAAVAAQDLDAAAAEETAAAVRKLGVRALTVSGDITQLSVIESTLAKARKEFGQLDILVNNAGIYPISPFVDMPVEVMDRVLNLNLRAVFLCTQRGGKMMAESGKVGSIVNMASVQAFRVGGLGLVHYNVTKAGVVMLTKAAALELAPSRVRVNAIAPGLTVTPGTKPIFGSGQLGDSESRIPLGRFGSPEDMGNAALFLCSPAASYITGETLVVDGGFMCS
jgi:2-deoxy-D-gluconate 3-dehydrogenase